MFLCHYIAFLDKKQWNVSLNFGQQCCRTMTLRGTAAKKSQARGKPAWDFFGVIQQGISTMVSIWSALASSCC